MNPKEFLKCLLLLVLIILGACLIALVMRADAVLVQLQIDIPRRLDSLEANVSKGIDRNLSPATTQLKGTLADIGAATRQANGLIADVRREIPVSKESLLTEVAVLNAKLDVTNQHVGELSEISGQLKPTIDGLNLMFRRDAVPAQTLGLLGASKVAAGEIAQTMKTVRDTVRTEAAPTAKAIRESAEGTAATTEATAKLIEHVDDLFFGPKTWKQKVQSWIRLLITPGALVGAKAL